MQGGKAESPFLHNPLRIRVNSELIRNVFHKRDQDILKIVRDLELGSYAIGDASIQNLQVSFEPNNGLNEEFDYKLSLDQEQYIGIESNNIKIKGKGKITHPGSEGEEFTIEGPVSDFRVAFQIDQKDTNAAPNAKKIIFKGIDLTFNNDDL